MEEELRKRIEELEAQNKELKFQSDQNAKFWIEAEKRCKVLEAALESIAITAGILKDSLVQKTVTSPKSNQTTGGQPPPGMLLGGRPGTHREEFFDILEFRSSQISSCTNRTTGVSIICQRHNAVSKGQTRVVVKIIS